MSESPVDVIACYLRVDDGELLIIPNARNPDWLYLQIDRPQRLPASASDQELGKAVRTARQWCDFALYNKDSNPTGERSWVQFAKKRFEVSVNFEGGLITLYPSARDKRGAYTALTKERVDLPETVSDEELGQAIRKAFAKCYEEGRR